MPTAAIVDYRLGNLFSVKHACEYVGLRASITSSKSDLLQADCVILPGIGAFGTAMETLRRLDLIPVLREIAASPRPLVGICLGVQLLMTESYEFGHHPGLGIISGPVVRLSEKENGTRRPKVPHVGWNRIRKAGFDLNGVDPWHDALLRGVADGEFMYFVHSFIVQPADPSVVVASTRYGDQEFCSTLRWRNVFAFQFHPERSGPRGLQIYRNLARLAQRASEGVES